MRASVMTLKLPQRRNIDEWQIYLWNLSEEVISRSQKLAFMLMLEAEFNAFDPYRVITDLLGQRSLWQGAVMDRGFLGSGGGDGRKWARLSSDLVKLRDISEGFWNVDTLFLLTEKRSVDPLRALAEGWDADEIHVLESEDVGALLGAFPAGDARILTVWWD